MTSLGLLARSIVRIVDLISLINRDLEAGTHRERGLYYGRIDSHSSSSLTRIANKEKTLISSIQYIEEKKENYLIEINRFQTLSSQEDRQLFSSKEGSVHRLCSVPKDLFLMENGTKLSITDKILDRSELDWPIVKLKVSPVNQEVARLNQLSQKGWASWIFASLLSLLGFGTRINFEYCEKGIEIGSYVFCYGVGKRVFTKGVPSEIVDVKYLTTNVGLMKNYLKEKIVENVILLIGLFTLFSASGFYLWQIYERGTITALQSNTDDVQPSNTSEITNIDFVQKHYPLYKEGKTGKIMKCKCGKNLRNVVNLPCCHLDLCFHCFANKQDKICESCHLYVYDYQVLTFKVEQ